MSSLPYRTKAKYLLLFFALLGLPSAILGYFALRGILNDRALAESELIAEHRRAARSVVETIDASVRNLESSLSSPSAHIAGSRSPNIRVLASQFHAIKPFDGFFFFVESEAIVVFPDVPLLYRDEPRHLKTAMELMSDQAVDDSGSYYEFRAREYAKALHWYQRQFRRGLLLETQAALLFSVARCQRHLSNLVSALETYRKLPSRCVRVPVTGGLPAGLVAELEIIQLTSGTSHSGEAVQLLRVLASELNAGTWLLDRDQYHFVASELQRAVRDVTSGAGPDSTSIALEFEALSREQDAKLAATQRLLKFEREVVPPLLDSLRRTHRPVQSLRYLKDVGGFRFGVVARSVRHEEGVPSAVSGVLIMLDQTGAQFAADILAGAPMPPSTVARITDEHDSIVAGSPMPARARLTVQEKVAGGFPPWTVTLFHRDRSVLEEMLSSRRSIYVITLLLVVCLLIAVSSLLWRFMAKELELATMQSDFVSMVSHELRSPLTSIRQLAEMLHSDRVPSEARRRQYYDVIVQQSERLSRLIENILDLSRVENGKLILDREEVNPLEFVRGVVAPMQNRLLATGFTIVVRSDELLPPFWVDRQAMAEAITNVIDNAVKYSGDSKVVEIRLFRSGGAICIVVRDYGIGIGKEDLEKVFQKFYRARSPAARSVRGTGLGLTLAKSIVEAHGGTMTAESQPGKGSTFTLKLPLPAKTR